jgi:cellulose biosynthesis protein BcsQ
MKPSAGKIVTFYSYKGGTGRTMALANVAWILAANRKRVLVVDWDLEAPGLHRYFLPFMDDPDLERTSGLIEMVSDYLTFVTQTEPDRPPGVGEALSVADPRRYAIALQFDFECDGALHLLAAGRHDDKYGERVRGLDWQKFYVSFGGSKFVSSIADRMRTEYDYVLIDSRTGVADVAGICTMELPDQLVICFTYNRQSVEGAAAVARSVTEYAKTHQRSITLMPLPTRVVADVEGVEEAREFAQTALLPFLPHMADHEVLLTYWDSAEIPHYPSYGFEETLATFRERAGGRNNLLADMEW